MDPPKDALFSLPQNGAAVDLKFILILFKHTFLTVLTS